MKNLILVISIVASSIFQVQATSENDLLNDNLNTTDVTSVYVWNVITNNGTFSGTSSSLAHAKKMIQLSGADDIILEQKIITHYVFKQDAQNKLYYWEVESSSAKAVGYSSSEANAKKLIKLVAKGDIITYKIIVNKKL